MTDQMPDFDSMSPEEIMSWMEALAVRQGATEGIINDVSNVQIAEIDPSIEIADEYIPYGMDPEVWAKKKAIEDANKAERLAVMKAEKDAKAAANPPTSQQVRPTAPPPVARPPERTPEPASLDFMSDLMGGSDESSDLMAAFTPPPTAPIPTTAAEPAADLSGGFDFLSGLGGASDSLDDFGSFDFSGLNALGMDEPAASSGASMDWLESIVSDSKPVQTVSNDSENELAAATLPDTTEASLSETAVERILDDSMDWLSDFAEDKPMQAVPAAMDLDSLFPTPQKASTTHDAETDGIRSALKQGNAQPDDVKAWMDSMLDKGLSRTDVSDENLDDDDDSQPLEGDIPAWLTAQVGAPPDLSVAADSIAESEADLPGWLTAPVSEEQTAEFEAIFSDATQDDLPQTPAKSSSMDTAYDTPEPVGLLDTTAIQVEMNDPWVEAFELERSERMGDTDQLADWYTGAQADLKLPTDVVNTMSAGVTPNATLQPANLKPETDLQAGEAQAVPVWLGGDSSAGGSATDDGIPDWLQSETLNQQVTISDDDDLPAWLRPQADAATAEPEPMPDWLNKRVVTDEFAAMTDSPVAPSAPTIQVPVAPRPVVERAMRVSPTITPSEIAQLLNEARGSLKMGDVGAMVAKYEALVRAQAALEEVSTDLAAVSRDPSHKGNPAVLRVYGDALMRQGKLQAALDTYRAALNLL